MVSRVVWVSPSPLWDDLLPHGTARFRAPALLRFDGDDFMDEFQQVVASRPGGLHGYVARPETWRKPAAGLGPPHGSANGQGPAGGAPLKLFQPIHGRYYLVTASLACRVPGLPEHTVDLAGGDTVSFVLRRRTAAGAELAWATSSDGDEGWAAAEPRALAPGEETLPMFPTMFGSEGLTRRVFAGLVPAGRREAYVGGRSLPTSGSDGPGAASGAAGGAGSAGDGVAAAGSPLEEPRVLEFQRAVLDPWVSLRDWHLDEAEQGRADEANRASEQASALILLDFATWLADELPQVWQAMATPALAASLPTAQRAVYDALDFDLRTGDGATAVPLRQALRTAHERAADIEALALPLGPEPRTTPEGVTPVLLVGPLVPTDSLLKRPEPPSPTPEEAPGVHVRPLKNLVMNALATVVTPAGEGVPGEGADAAGGEGAGVARRRRLPLLPPLNAQGDDLYVVRCVYARPRCGKGHPVLVGDASEPFQLASFFDPDAPQRPVRVALPIDTSAAGLRKFDKNVGFMLSNELRKQMSRVKGMKELLDGDVRDPRGLDLSVLCSFSIPIITLCALILLMIIVALLNFVFFWIPFVIQCFPVPSLKAKE